MNKAELAAYLVNLHTLMDAQHTSGVQKSSYLIDEYNRGWEELKQLIKETSDEAGSSNKLQDGVDKG